MQNNVVFLHWNSMALEQLYFYVHTQFILFVSQYNQKGNIINSGLKVNMVI